MKTALLILFGIVSFLTGLYFLIRAVYVYKNGKREKRILSAIQVYTIGVFAAVLAVFIPIYYTSYDFGDAYSFLMPLLIAIHNSLRIFILDGDFDIIVNSLSDQNVALRVCFSLYSAFLYVIAPVLTFSNVLSLFKNLKEEIRYRLIGRKNLYIMSELNNKSIALAKSICNCKKSVLVVFTDVFEQNEEDDYELLTQARDINAICLKKDISHLDVASKKGEVELFLIGNDESENVSQAVAITTELNKKNSKHNVKVFVFSTKPSAAYIIDSIKYDNLLQHAAENDYNENCFKLRRIDERQQLIWNTVPQMKLFDIANRNDKTLSVLIVGLGSYGMEFFKTLLWYCQFEGYKLQINIVDKSGKCTEEKGYIESLIKRSCPELLKTNKCDTIGDAHYDIQIFSGVDALTADIDELLLSGGNTSDKASIADRLRATNLAFVSLGDDDVNIEVSIHLRGLFDRMNGVIAKESINWEQEAVDIYSVVYDDRKSSILYSECSDNNCNLLRNYKNIPYHIHFIGGMSMQFDYQNIYDAELERCAYQHHAGWVDIEKKPEKAKAEQKKYEQYEYYRRSSIAKELYRRGIRNNPELLSQTICPKPECECENCIRRKRSEHMRWNAYTRVIGYAYDNGIRADRALLHNLLCEWDQLSDDDKKKD